MEISFVFIIRPFHLNYLQVIFPLINYVKGHG